MSGKRSGKEGVALIFVIFAALVILGAVTAVMMRVHSAKRMTDRAVDSIVLEQACKAGIDFGIERIWNDYITGNGNTTGNLASYRLFINNLASTNEDVNGNGRQDENERDLNGNGSFDIAEPTVFVDEGDPLILEAQAARVTNVTLERRDDVTGSLLTLRATAQIGDGENVERRVATQTIRVSGEPFFGYEYAVLAKNINCILCHAEIRNLQQHYHSEPDEDGVYDRVKVATLQSLLYRLDQADSAVAGTVYTRGDIYDKAGNTVTASQVRNSSFDGYAFDRDNGKLDINSSGGMNRVDLDEAGTTDEGLPEQFASLYKNYPSDHTEMTDGPLPDTFPAPYPDDDEDRYVDDDEFQKVANALDGSITGGVVYGVPEGSMYGASALPTSSNTASSDMAAGHYDGNLILVGTDDNPIEVNGEVSVDGDLVIKGKVKGWGQLFVRRNTYVVGDVTYADAPGEFGKAVDGTTNGLGLISGGSVLMGDYLTIRGKSHTDDGSKYPNKSYSIDVRDEHKSSDVSKNGETQTLQYGYFDPGVVDANGIYETMLDDDGNEVLRTGQQFSFTQSELMLFNILELEKAAADPDYRPRFYGLRDTQPNNVFIYHKPPDEHAVRYDERGGGVQYLYDYMLANGIDLDIWTDPNRRSIHYMNPDSNWISEDVLRQIWWNDEMSRDQSGDPMQFDGLMYSNNAIFTIVRSRSRHDSYTDGKLFMRGAVICPDLGVLAPGNGSNGTDSFLLLYDNRVRRFWSPEDTTQVAFQRLVYNITTPSREYDGTSVS